uniref:protein turtle-like isoform X1 n=1 Tax=Osmia lignaria TaxID=473952 RepID=UPI0014785E60|nr:protein turtle-like isoform X1 [Osmia lignaria]XP_034187573.1 protein turtle-like isoform X1 [Osmia lignaria]XP_034187574.1 protein turtle-like isoform X1 [Osmia lignaria]XP_034187575.1 protein turtle-like isoform X1 [Osmia lignaria]XP_034187576.1 protein turtle-like isoform X1 [Osmia lignaria]XP_034187577.1 protein turtle-like isoform X1 [Osmia lignaria]
MGGGGGLQATDLRRRLESRCSGSTFPQGLPSIRHDGCRAAERSLSGQEGDSGIDLETTLASGQPTCTSSRSYRRHENEENEEKKKGARCTLKNENGVIDSLYGKLRFSVGRLFGADGEEDEEGNRNRHRLRWFRRDFRWLADVATRTLLLGIVLFVTPGLCHQDAVHITAILGESVVFNCHVEFPGEHPVPYVLQWEKKVGNEGQEIPIYIWYESYPTHSGEGYEGRVSRVSPNSPYGVASLNLTDIRESDQGWYECKIVFLNRSPNSNKNGTWFHLDVHAPPKFSITPEEMIYVNVGDAIILNCQAEGTPTPEILWYKDANPVEPSSTIGIFNDGTELRISTIKNEDIGDYTCIARNGEGQISHTARVIIAGGAVITVPPTNQTKLEGEKVQFSCEAKALPGNVTVRWFREGAPVTEVSALDTRVSIKTNGSLVINPVSADDSGQYLCEVTNGIGDPQSASAYLNVEYSAKVTFTPTVQYLPFRLAGVVQCYIKANPPLQYVTWTKDKRLLEPYQTKDIVVMNNGSLLFTRVNENHQGRYTCTPYNAQGTQGSSGPMEVLVRNPPVFTLEPEPIYQKKVGETVEMHCDAQEAEGTQKPTIQWHRRDGASIQRNRAKMVGGNLTIESLRRSDFGFYQCVASNEVATISASTQLIVEGTQPHAPYNVSGTATEFSVTLTWLPGYSGGPDYKQDYTIWYRESGTSEWETIPVTPSGSTTVTINRLTPGTLYEFQVIGKNALGDGMLSKVITVRTLDVALTHSATPSSSAGQAAATDQSDILDYNTLILPTDSTGNPAFPPIMRPKGPKPGPPRNLTVTEISNGFLITWQPPLERSHLIQYYTIKYKTDGPWKMLNKGQIRPEETSYLVKNLVGGRTYYFQVFANSATNYGVSEQVKFPVPARVKHKAITAGVVGGILFFIVAIILSICAVKICNKRKRRKQEKELLSAYSMVACRVTDARNGAGQGPQGTVPLKKPRKSRVPGLNLLREILSPDTPDSCRGRPLGKISRAADGRFVVADSVLSSANNSILDASSSDDGGFLPKQRLKSSWRRPLVGTSQLSLRSEGSGVSIGGLPSIHHHHHHHHGTVNSLARIAPAICTISSPRFLASSPSGQQVPWTPLYFSDLSSVRQPSSGERSFPTPPDYLQLRTVHQRYSQELPSLKAIHAESRRFVPVQPLATSSPPQPAGRPRARLPPRHARHARSAPELAASPDLETSPESRSSSSGFGSKNTSQQNQSSRSGSTVAEWRPPPYRPPPPPLVGRWLELQDQAKVGHTHIQNAVDAGSVDGHYEFDPVSCTPTPTSASTPTREERPPVVHQIHTIHVPHIHQVHTVHHQPPRYSRDNIEARVQAMKAEFHQFRQRQARRRQSAHLESAC